MNPLTRLWTSLSRNQQISLVVVPILILAGIYGLVRWKHDSGFRVLYSSLSPEDASAVTQKMREGGIEYRLDETGATVMVPEEHLADARLALAGAGMPKSGRIGFELFDKNNLGASDFAEQVNYRRALEGELERTIATLSEIDQARVHITFAKESVFLDNRQPSKATVVLVLKHSSQISQSSVTAIANLVAGAVDGLSPGSIAIIDSAGRLLNRPRAEGSSDVQLAEANLEYRQQVETAMLAKIDSALTPLLGPDKFRANVTADFDFSSSEQNEEIYDPNRTALVSSQTTDESSGGQLVGGSPGTASALPRPTGTAGTAGAPATTAVAAAPRAGSTGLTRRTENVAYQPSRTVKHTVTPKGEVRRMSVAVLLDQTVRWDGTGPKAKRTFIPPSAEMLKGVHDIVAGVSGFNEQRGDLITVETLPFDATSNAEPPPPQGGTPKTPAKTAFNLKQPAVIGGAAAVVLLFALVILLLIRRRSPATARDMAAAALEGGADPGAIAGGRSTQQKMEQQIADNAAEQARIEADALRSIQLPPSTGKTEVLVKHIRESITKDSGNATNVLRSWISDVEPKKQQS